MLRNNITRLTHELYMCNICVPVYHIYKKVSSYKGLRWYTTRYTGGTQAAETVHRVSAVL